MKCFLMKLFEKSFQVPCTRALQNKGKIQGRASLNQDRVLYRKKSRALNKHCPRKVFLARCIHEQITNLHKHYNSSTTIAFWMHANGTYLF